ncbi:E3 ubiquitin-protein ligase RNF19A [Lates japonicus]|uniref:E3 ubiquitin-protein ligase RNF19A n=1 Tax=Lates japonicus TaxID=270547 RepID=A0AAD3RM79_LATJO|nr:E3 ubiquitin-protein ligase RNF19A [Lates japonicus]
MIRVRGFRGLLGALRRCREHCRFKLKDFLRDDETLSHFLHHNASLPRHALKHIVEADVNLEKVLTKGFGFHLRDLCNTTPLEEFVHIADRNVSHMTQEIICKSSSDWLNKAQSHFLSNLDFLKPIRRDVRSDPKVVQEVSAATNSLLESLGALAVEYEQLNHILFLSADDIKPCPRCAAYIIKMNDGSCNHMTCAVCGCEFCWLCMKEISDLHYLSPSGCTFWGKKPWSRKKKILWQLGTLVGAPVGIALIAGIAIPAMIIGIPVYVGRKIHNRYEGKDISNHKRNLVIAGGVTLSVIVSPVVAAVTVGIGVPIMLAYVYGVVPISLCRSGGCGVSAGNGKGVRIEFDDENDMNVGSGAAATDTTSVADTRNNPSIGEGSVGGLTGSLSASGSHMDRLGAMRDNLSETASTMALAGASITGSLSGSAMVNYLNRLEVQADVQKERCSLSGESGTVSLGTISDNASTKAMAGSILNAYMPLDRDGNSMEVQVDIESKPSKQRHHSGSSSVDDSGHVGRCGWTCPSNGCTSSEGKGTSTKWAKEASCCSSSSSGGKKSKGKLRKKGCGGTKINETREDMDAQLLEQRSTNSSEFDSPSLSGSLPSVADSHSSHFSEFSCSDLESMKTSCSHGSGGGDYHTRFATVSPLPEVENDRLETCPTSSSSSSQGQGTVITPHSPNSTTSSLGHGAELSPLCFITEENVNLVCPAELDSHSNTGEQLKETNNNHHRSQHPSQTQQQPKNSCIQTDI